MQNGRTNNAWDNAAVVDPVEEVGGNGTENVKVYVQEVFQAGTQGTLDGVAGVTAKIITDALVGAIRIQFPMVGLFYQSAVGERLLTLLLPALLGAIAVYAPHLCPVDPNTVKNVCLRATRFQAGATISPILEAARAPLMDAFERISTMTKSRIGNARKETA